MENPGSPLPSKSRQGSTSALRSILERGLPQVRNGVGQKDMTEALSRSDTAGEPIRFGSDAMTSKGRFPECDKTLFGQVELEGHTDQSREGGKTFCPLEHHARLCENASSGLCQILAAKHVSLSGRGLPFRQAQGPERSRRAAGDGAIPPARF
jgi:hypothetical protein